LCFFLKVINHFYYFFWNSLFDIFSSTQVFRSLVWSWLLMESSCLMVSLCVEIYASGIVCG
jgi:hypothetical protein